MRCVLLIFFLLTCNAMHSQELARIRETYPEWVTASIETPVSTNCSPIQSQFIQLINPHARVVEWFRNTLCRENTKHVSKTDLVIHTRFFSISRYEMAQFGWDFISYAFVHAMKGKEIDEIWSPALNQACTNRAEHRITTALSVMITKNEKDIFLVKLIKEHSPSFIAQGVLFATKSYILPAIKYQSLAILTSCITKKK
ncbi:MAG: hypothetical protein AMXMBFR12_03680 [Candidatus Babeliales bacterium]